MALNPAGAEAVATGAQNLDAIFGELLEPGRVDPLESSVQPLSLQRLDVGTAKWLKAFMQATESGLGVTRFVYCELPILWVTDKAGDIWFAVEEIVTADTHEFVRPRLRNASFETKYHRLGHPALLRAEAGRIGGEILFDVRADQPAWFITNGSGRYGLRPGRLPMHLSGANRKFQEHGITLKELFIEPQS
jgi:hypothetical protein